MEEKTGKQVSFLAKEGSPTTIYCNQVQMAFSVWDVVMDVGQADTSQITEIDGQKVVPVDYKARIVMSPQHAKAFANLLSQNILKYEQEFGELNIKAKER